MARRRRSPLRRALHAMAPHRVLWRALSGPEVMSAVRSKTRTQTVRVNATTRQAEVQRATKSAAKKTAAKKPAKRADPYAVAAGIPAQNRKAAASMARAAAPKKPAPMSERVLRGQGGKLAGSRPALSADDQALYQRARDGYVDPQMRVRNSRTRRG